MTEEKNNHFNCKENCSACRSKWLDGVHPDTIKTITSLPLETIERISIIHAFVHNKWSRKRTAKMLGMPIRTLQRKTMKYSKELNIQFPRNVISRKEKIFIYCVDCPRKATRGQRCEPCYRARLRQRKTEKTHA